MEDTDPNDDTAENLYPALVQCFSVIVCGYLAGRFNLISQTESKGLNTFVGNFALPSLIFQSLAQLKFSTVNWMFLLSMLIAKTLVFFGVLIISLLVARPLNFGRAGLFAIFCTQSNDFAIGYPIVDSIYGKTHPEYADYLYLMAPISLAILNPIAFVFMEIGKERQNSLSYRNTEAQSKIKAHLKLAVSVIKGIVTNPIVFMTSLGIIGNAIFKNDLPVFLSKILTVFGSAFSGTALFLLGLRMVGKLHQLRGPALILPFVLIIIKLLVLPIVMRETVSLFNAGTNLNDTKELSSYGFLYGTFPTAPAVFVFATQYSLDIDLIASCMVACTFVSAPLMFISARMTSITKDYAPQLCIFEFDISIVAIAASIWMIIFFIATKKYNRMPHRITFCLAISQLIMSIGIIWEGASLKDVNPWIVVVHESIKYFGIMSCRLWTAILAVAIVYLQSRGPCFVLKMFPWLCIAAWGSPALIIFILILTNGPTPTAQSEHFMYKISIAILSTCLLVSVISLVLYVRHRKRNARYLSLSADIADPIENVVSGNETTSLIENPEQIAQIPSPKKSINAPYYGTISKPTSPSKNCCGGNLNCDSATSPSTSRNVDIEDLVPSNNTNCICPQDDDNPCNSNSENACPYIEAVERAAGALGLEPTEQSAGHGGQIMRHTVLLIAYAASMFLGLGFVTWSLVLDEMTGIYVEIKFLDITLNYGQSLILWVIFGLEASELILPLGKLWRRIWNGADAVALTPLDQLSFETKHVCEQFITHHLEKCKESIAKDTRWRIKTYHNVFRGSCLVRWLCGVGLARDSAEAVTYGRHLLEGRLIAHINNVHHFHDSPLLYVFI